MAAGPIGMTRGSRSGRSALCERGERGAVEGGAGGIEKTGRGRSGGKEGGAGFRLEMARTLLWVGDEGAERARGGESGGESGGGRDAVREVTGSGGARLASPFDLEVRSNGGDVECGREALEKVR